LFRCFGSTPIAGGPPRVKRLLLLRARFLLRSGAAPRRRRPSAPP
jgi:hypothetical protein